MTGGGGAGGLKSIYQYDVAPANAWNVQTDRPQDNQSGAVQSTKSARNNFHSTSELRASEHRTRSLPKALYKDGKAERSFGCVH